jgi:hypothetical protein
MVHGSFKVEKWTAPEQEVNIKLVAEMLQMLKPVTVMKK